MSTPKISIIIPLYNQHKKLLACLDSIKKQTIFSPPVRRGGGVGGEGVEIIIVNDGSTDISQHELNQKIKQFNHLTILVTHQSNQGAPTARNNGFKESTGQYVIFCDADVVMKPLMLEKMSKVLAENPDVSYVYSSFKFGWKKFKLWEFSAKRLREMPYIHTTSLMRREHFPGFDPNLKRLQDWDVWLTMLEQGHTGKWIPEVLFTVKTGGTMSNWTPSFLTKLSFYASNPYNKAVRIVKNKHRLT